MVTKIKKYGAEWTLIEIDKILNPIKEKPTNDYLTSEEIEDSNVYFQRGRIKVLLEMWQKYEESRKE